MLPVQPQLSSPPIIRLIRFQCPPIATAEIIMPVLPQRRYSIAGL